MLLLFESQGTIYNIQYTIYNIQYTIYNIQYILSIPIFRLVQSQMSHTSSSSMDNGNWKRKGHTKNSAPFKCQYVPNNLYIITISVGVDDCPCNIYSPWMRMVFPLLIAEAVGTSFLMRSPVEVDKPSDSRLNLPRLYLQNRASTPEYSVHVWDWNQARTARSS